MVRKTCQVAGDRPSFGQTVIPTLGEISIEEEVDGVDIVGAGQWIGIGDVRRRSGRMALAVAPENGVAAAEHDGVGGRTAQERLMEVVGYRIFVGEAL